MCSSDLVVAIEGDVELAHEDLLAGELFHQPGQAMRQMRAAGMDADESQLPGILILFEDFVGDADDGASELIGGDYFPNKKAAHSRVPDADTRWRLRRFFPLSRFILLPCQPLWA